MDRLDGARVVALAGLGLTLAAVPLIIYLYGLRWLLSIAPPGTVLTAAGLFLPGLLVTGTAYWFYQRLPVALRARTRVPFLSWGTSIALPLMLLLAAVIRRLSLITA